MNRLEANVCLFAITFFAAAQYAFLSAIPASVSNFAFLFITNLIGFIFALFVFFSEFFRIDRKQVLQSMILAAELFGFNCFLLAGSSGMEASVVSCVITLYFVFLPVILLVMRKKIKLNTYIGLLFVVIGVLMVMGTGISGFANVHVIYLIISDIFFAFYIVTVERFCSKSNPAILAMGQMLFGSFFALSAWVTEAMLSGQRISLPSDVSFWSSVIFISFFIRCLYGVVQIYAQRYVSALNTALIFSTEIIITLLISPLLSFWMGFPHSKITPLKITGCIFVMIGVLAADESVVRLLKRRGKNDTKTH